MLEWIHFKFIKILIKEELGFWKLISSFETYLKILGEPMLVIRIELTNVFNKLFDRNGFHVICGDKMTFRVTQNILQ